MATAPPAIISAWRNRDAALSSASDNAGHAGTPQSLAADVFVAQAVHVLEGLERIFNTARYRRDELHEGLAIVGGDAAVGECRTQG